MATQIGPKIGIEGEKEYRNQLKQIINETKNLDAAMEKTASQWTKNTSQMTKNKVEAQNLIQKINNYNEQLKVQNQMLEESAKKYGENADATKSWQRAVDSTTASINSLKTRLNNLKGAENFSEFSTKMADFGTAMQAVGQKMTSIGQTMTATITLPLVAVGAASIKLASDLEESSSKTDVVFGNMSEAVKQFASEALNSYGLAEGTALQMASTFGGMATAMGLPQKEAAKMSISLTGLAADMASFYNVSTEVAQTSLQGIFTGEAEALKKFGVVMNQTNLEAFAAQQGKVYSQMTEGEKVMTRYAFVMNATKDAQGDFSRTSDGTANSLRVFQESLKELGAAFGEALLPVITPVIQKITAMVQKFANLPEPIKQIIAMMGLLIAAIGPVILIIGMFVSALGSIITGIPAIISGLTGLAAAFGVVDIAAAPIIGILLAVAAAIVVGAIAGYELAKHWDEISEAAGRMGNSIKSAFQDLMSLNNTLKNNVNGFVADIASAFAQLPRKIIQALKQAVQAIKDQFNQMIQNAKKSGADFVSGFIDGIKSKVQGLINQVKDIAQTIEDYLGFSTPDKGPLHKYNTWMPDFLNGLAKGIKQNESIVTNAINGLAKSMVLPLDSSASMNMALSGSGGGYASEMFGNMTTNVYVDHINDLQDLVRIQNQAQQRYRMGAR